MPTLRVVGRKWWIWQDVGGKQVRRSTGYPVLNKQTKEAALRRATEIELDVRAQQNRWEKDVPTVWEFWTTTYRPLYTVKKRHPERDYSIMAHVEASALASMRMDDVQKSDCDRYLTLRRSSFAANPGRKHPAPLSENTIQRERALLHAVFQQAVENELIDRNPWRKVERKDYTARNRILTPDVQVQLLRRLSPRYQRFVRFLVGTGLRLGELRGIKVERDLHLERRYVTVTGKFGKTRDVPLSLEVIEILKEQLEREGRLWPQSQWRLRHVLLKACSPRYARRPARNDDGTYSRIPPGDRTLLEPALPRLSPHDLRHTFGHRWLKDGGDIFKLSKILGHESVAVTQRHYAYLLTEDLVAAMDQRDLGIKVGIPEPVSQ